MDMQAVHPIAFTELGFGTAPIGNSHGRQRKGVASNFVAERLKRGFSNGCGIVDEAYSAIIDRCMDFVPAESAA